MRVIDIFTAFLGLLALSPLLLLIAILICLESPGGALFMQSRIGKNGKHFTCLKFRTMFQGTGDHPTHNIGKDRVTRVGHFLRRSKLDEIPQLLNVLRGEMSLVGPRPSLLSQTQIISLRQESGALDVLPGITGLAQIRGVDMSVPIELAKIDGDYAASRTVFGDLKIIANTFIHIIKPEKSSYKAD